MPDFQSQRRMMVDTQIRPSDVTKFPIIDAFLNVTREAFVPESHRAVTYAGGEIPLSEGRVMLEPRSLAKMLDALDLQRSEMVLDLGCGLGYSTAILAHMAQAVIGVEEDAELAAEAQSALASEGVDNAVLVDAPLTEGAAQYGPYDAMIVQGGVQEIPAALLEQLKEDGRIIAIFMDGPLGEVRLGHKLATGMSWRMVFNASAPLLPSFTRKSDFVF